MPKSVRPLGAMPSRLTIKRGDGVAVDLKIEEEPCADITGLTRLALYAITFTAEPVPELDEVANGREVEVIWRVAHEDLSLEVTIPRAHVEIDDVGVYPMQEVDVRVTPLARVEGPTLTVRSTGIDTAGTTELVERRHAAHRDRVRRVALVLGLADEPQHS